MQLAVCCKIEFDSHFQYHIVLWAWAHWKRSHGQWKSNSIAYCKTPSLCGILILCSSGLRSRDGHFTHLLRSCTDTLHCPPQHSTQHNVFLQHTFWNSVCTVLFYYSAPTHNTDWCILCYKTKGSTTLTGVKLPEQSTTVNKLNCISTRRSLLTVYCKQLLKTFGLKHPTIEFINSCAPQRKLDTTDLPVPLQHPKILCGHEGGHQCDNWSGRGYH